MSALRDTIYDLSEAQIDEANGYDTGGEYVWDGSSSYLKYEMILKPADYEGGAGLTGTAFQDFLDDMNALTADGAKSLAEEMDEDTEGELRLGTPGKPSRLIRAT